MKNTLKNHLDFVHVFDKLGNDWVVDNELVESLKNFVVEIYKKSDENLDTVRCHLFCDKAGKIDPESLPPFSSTLGLHIKRANYQAGIWKNALVAKPIIPNPYDHGWILEDNELAVQWLGSKPAPDEVLSLISCVCKRTCKEKTCCCLQPKLKCTTLCTANCKNMSERNLYSENFDEDYNDMYDSNSASDDEED